MTTKPTTSTARRVTIYRAADGWRYRVQSSNWRIIEASEQAFARRSTVEKRVAARWPDVEVRVQP